jgi:flagellar hook-associated protein 2
MATISSIGVGSGLDATAIINALLSVQRQPIDLLATEAKSIDAKLSSFGKVQSYLDSMRTTATKLKTSTTWSATSATTSNSAALTVSSGSGTSPGSYSVNVTRLATAQMTASPAAATATSTVGQGTLRIQLGTWNDSVDDFTEKTGSSALDITIGPGEDTLTGIRDKINGTAGLGVKASIVNDAGGARLVLQSSSTGASNGFRVQVVGDSDLTDEDGGGLSQLAFDPETFAPVSTRPQAGLNATATINNLPVESETNTLDNVIDGVSLKLAALTTSPAAVTVTRDTASMKTAVQEFITSYNSLIGLLRDQTKYDAGSKSAGTLQGDRTAITLQSQLRSMIGANSSASASFVRASDIGLDIQTDGTIKLNSSKLDTALANPTELGKFFSAAGGSNATDGLGERLQKLATSWTSFDGALTGRTAGLKKLMEMNSTRQATLEQRVAVTEARLRAQYSALDAQMANLNGLQSYVSQQVTNWSKN